MRYISLLTLSAAIILSSCTGSDTEGNNQVASKAPFVRLDKISAQFEAMNPQQQYAAVDSFTIPLNDYLYLMGASTDNIPASIDSLTHTAAFSMFEPEVDKAFPSTAPLEEKLGILNANMKSMLPTLPSYSYYGIVSPYRQKVVLVDSTVFVALNHYLGATHEAYSSMPEYLRATKTAAYIPLDIAEAIISIEKPYVADSDPTVIQKIIYEGALLKAVSDLTGITEPATLMGWSRQQLADVTAKEADIWRKMAADNMIYSTDMTIADRLCAPSPSSQAISPDLPGRVGRYIGYQIVTSYIANNPGADIAQLLSPSFYNSPSALINSGYAPRQ